MKFKSLGIIIAAFAVFGIMMGASITTGHEKGDGNALRNSKQCKNHVKDKKKREECFACVNKSYGRYHFHKKAPKAYRCRYSNGRP